MSETSTSAKQWFVVHTYSGFENKVASAIELIMPIAMEKELRFAIREGGRTVGAGVVTAITE